MTSLMEFIRGAVPTLASDDVTQLIKHLENLGIRSKEDCFTVTQEEVNHLKPIHRFQLLDACSQGRYRILTSKVGIAY